MRRIGDYPQGEWLEAADACQDCGAHFEVNIEDLVEADAATVRVRAAHRDGCEWAEEEPGAGVTDAGWGLADVRIELGGQTYQLLDWYLDVMACCGCERLMVGVPLLIFPEGGILALCWSCAKQWGILDLAGIRVE